MADVGELKIPAAMWPVAESIIARTDHVSLELYVLAQVNFLFDAATKPCLTTDDLSAASGVGKSTLSNTAALLHQPDLHDA